MSKLTAYSAIGIYIVCWIVLTLSAPQVLSDNNTFMKGFINQELLTMLGVIVALTIGAATNLHIELNKIEERKKRVAFDRARKTIKQSISWLLWMFLAALILVVIKPLLVGYGERALSFLNGLALLILFVNFLVLIDLTHAVFELKPKIN